jgi:hypothetical protein
MSQVVSSPYVSEKEAAAFLSVSLPTIRRWRRPKVGPTFFRFGGVLRYSLDHLQSFISQNQTSVE